jgi:hypothetical protein
MAGKRLSRYSEHAMENLLFEGEMSRSLSPLHFTFSYADRLQRLRAILGALHDALELAGIQHSPHLEQRATVCDIVSDELADIADGLNSEDGGRRGRKRRDRRRR